jgi:hypothetical protein
MTDETDTPADEPFLNADVAKFVDEDKLVDEIASYLEDRAMKILLGSHGTKADPVMAGHIMAAGTVVRSRTWKGFKNGA